MASGVFCMLSCPHCHRTIEALFSSPTINCWRFQKLGIGPPVVFLVSPQIVNRQFNLLGLLGWLAGPNPRLGLGDTLLSCQACGDWHYRVTA